MTDNRTTELLHRMLRDRGVEYTTRDGMKATSITHITHWYADGVDAEFTEQIKGCTRLTASGLTPEQAIAATLGSEREKRLEELARSLYADYHDEWPDRAEEVYAERMRELGIEVIADER